MRGSSPSELFPVKNRKEATISDKERVKKRWVEHFENVLNRERIAGKDIDFVGEKKKNIGELCDHMGAITIMSSSRPQISVFMYAQLNNI